MFFKVLYTKVEIKDFNLLIDRKSFFYTPVINKEETYEKIIEKSKKHLHNW